MFIIRIQGGLGNQMFQYSLYRRLLAEGKEAYMDISSYQENPVHNNYELSKVFHITERLATEEQIKKVRRFVNELNIFQRAYRKAKILLGGLQYVHYTAKTGSFDPMVLQLKGPRYLDGYWHFHKYFGNIESILRQEFVFKNIHDSQNDRMAKVVKNTNAVSVHVRRGDYVNNPLHGNICDLNYYQKAIQLIIEKVINPTFFVFSDDIHWCVKYLPLKNAKYVDFNNKGEDSYKDMYLMSLCQHNILPNSSFSWWAAWLNQNPNKIVIAPNRWLNGYNIDYKDLIPQEWLMIEV